MAELTIATGLKEMVARLDEAVVIAKASLVCADAGADGQALRIAIDVDELLHEAIALHGAVRLIGRLACT